jgi:hypothetical protein
MDRETRMWNAMEQMASALRGEQMPDGCVRGCPVRECSDRGHNPRCNAVSRALAAHRETAQEWKEQE